MKKYPKLVQVDARGQIVIPKDVRVALGLDESSGFYVYVTKTGIFLKQVEPPDISDDEDLKEIEQNAEKIGLDKKSLDKLKDDYSRNKGGLERI